MYFPSSEGGGFHVVLKGSCWLIPPAPEPPIALNVGDVAFVRGRIAHGIADSPSSRLVELRFDTTDAPYRQVRGEGSGTSTVVLCGAYMLDETRAHPLLSEIPPIVHLPAQLGRHSSLRVVVEQLGSELERPLPGIGAMVPALLDMLLLSIFRAWFAQRPPDERGQSWGAALNDPAIVAALTAIHEDPAHPWTVAELGGRAGLSRAAFARRFTALIGQPPLTYLTWWRTIVAARLLRESDEPLRVIARRVGYISEIAFAAAFKREHGLTPARYRRLPDGRIDSA
jgi:AraC-like DNA-binding protein